LISVFQFSKSVVDSNQLRSLDGTLYALSLHDHNSSNSLNANTSHMLNAANARDMVNLRDAVTSQHYDTIFPSLLVDSDSTIIEPSVSIPMHNPEVWKTQRRQMTTIASDPPPVSSLSNTKHPATTKVQGRKPTTAHSFFASNQKSASNAASSLLQSKATVTKTPILEKENSNNPTTKISTPIQSNTALSTIGNVDDFVGDIEEDDDFLQQEALRQERRSKAEELQAKRQIVKKTSARPRPPLPPNPDSPKQIMNRHYTNPLSQSSDGTDAETHTKVAAVPGIKRRKTLVDKTTMDEHGYIHTETVVVWEDLPDDPPLESSQPHASSTTISKPSHSRPVKSTTNFKQGTLRGFFTPK
jgi:DNA polymerase subunit Cdc27